MTVPKRIRLKPLRGERKRDLGLPILCFLFLVGRALDLLTFLDAYRIVGHAFFNPANHPLVRLVWGLPFSWLGDYEGNPFNMAVVFYSGIDGLLALQVAIAVVVPVGMAIAWKLSYRLIGWRGRWSRRSAKAILYFLTLISVVMAVQNSTQFITRLVILLTYSF